MAGRSRRVVRGLALAGATALVIGVGLPLAAGPAQAQTPGIGASLSPATGAAGTAIDVYVTGCSASQLQGVPAVEIELDTDAGSRDVMTFAFASPNGTTFHYVAPPEYDYAAGAKAGPGYQLRVRCAHTVNGGPGSVGAGTFTYTNRAPQPSTTSTSTTFPAPTTSTTFFTTTTVRSTTTTWPYVVGYEGNGKTKTTIFPGSAATGSGAAPTATPTTAAPRTTTTVAAAPVAPPSTTADGIVDDPTPAPGQLLTFGSFGFQPGSRVHVELHSTPVALGDFTVAKDGTVVGRVRIPEDTALGNHLIVISGVDPSGARLVRQLPVLVTGGATRIPTTGGDDDVLLLAGLLLVGIGLVASGRAVARAAGRA